MAYELGASSAAKATAPNLVVLTAAVRALPGVTDAAAIIRGRGPTSRPAAAVPPRSAKTSSPANDAAINAREATSGSKPPAEVYGGPLSVLASAPATLPEALRWTARSPLGTGTTYVVDDTPDPASRQTYRELADQAGRMLHGLRRSGLQPGDSVLFQLEDGRNFLTALWACILGGFIPTPVGLAPSYDEANAVTRRLQNAWQLLGRPPILTDAASAGRVSRLGDLWAEPRVELLVAGELYGPAPAAWHQPAPDDPVLQLLTSGSTGVPKCVRHSHRSILARSRAVAVATGLSDQDVSLNWMPLDHVGGIVMYHLRDVILGCEHVNAPTGLFLADPLHWLDWIDRFRVSDTWAPNFAFALVNECAQEISRRQWDLSSVRTILNGGEAVISRTAFRFLELLGQHGLRPDAVRPSWGMSETCSGVTYSRLDLGHPQDGVLTVSQDSLRADLRFVAEAAPGDATFTEVGRPIEGVRVRVADNNSTVLPEERIGRLQISGDTMMQGYFNNAAANERTYTPDGWFNTGDLAFLREGRLTIIGREGDVIVINGANYLSHDIESVLAAVPGIAASYVAACGDSHATESTDRLVVFYAPDGSADDARTASAIRVAVAREIGLPPALVVAVDRDEFPRTPSGKIQRTVLLDNLHTGLYEGRSFTAGQAPLAEPTSCFAPSWQQVEWPAGLADQRSGPWILLADSALNDAYDGANSETGVAEPDLASVLCAATGRIVIRVASGSGFHQVDRETYRVDPRSPADLTRVFALVTADHGRPAAVIHGWCSPQRPQPRSPDELRGLLDRSVHALRAVLSAVRGELDGDCPVLVLTRSAVAAAPGDKVDYATAALLGIVRTASTEGVVRHLRLIDVAEAPNGAMARLLSDLAADARPADGQGAETIVAMRQGAVLAQRLSAVDLPARPDVTGLVPGGHYLLTGGLGGVGFEIAQYLLAAYQVTLLIIGRTELSPGSDGEKAARLHELRQLGSVRYVALDIADVDGLERVVAAAEADWGATLTGVLHLAGADPATDDWDPIGRTAATESAATFEAMYQAKVYGTWALGRLLEKRSETLLVLFSSANGFFGGAGFAAYSSANSFVDGFADYWSGARGQPTRCLGWSTWSGIGMSAGNPPAIAAAARRRGFRQLTADEGLRLFLTALGCTEHRLLLGLDMECDDVFRTLNTSANGADGAHLLLAYVGGESEHGLHDEVRRTATELADPSGSVVDIVLVELIPRLADGTTDRGALLAVADLAGLGNGFAEPVGKLEAAVASTWREALNLSRVGRNDSFFDLAGDSIKAIRLLSKVNATMKASLSLHDLYKNNTVALMAERLDAARSSDDGEV
jgi:acyl-CoA synthetase (AMP-forming)/AMP-acid ligase II/NAD(P)-dependent dehydrogenase (short-subunit alcohol dehydrogenase family)